MSRPPIVLASGSPRRKALLESLGIPIEVRVSQVEENAQGAPAEVAVGNAIAKRDGVERGLPGDAIVIAADTIVVVDDTILGKPIDLDDARRMVSMLSGRVHDVVTGVAVVNTGTRDASEGFERTEVTFRDLSDEAIDAFVQTVRPLDRAGAYTVDGPGALLVERFNGCYQNVLGLPIVRLDELLRGIGDGLFDRIDADRARFL